MRTQKRLSWLAGLLASLALASCGGSDESSEEEVVTVVRTALTRTNPDDCKELMTAAYLEQSFRTDGASALEACEQNARAEESPNEIGAVTHVKVEGSRATADVADATSGGLGITLALVEEDGDWKLDEIAGFAGFDKATLLEEERKGRESGESSPEPAVVDCIVDALRKLSQAEIEEIWFGGSAQGEIEIEEGCEPQKDE